MTRSSSKKPMQLRSNLSLVKPIVTLSVGVLLPVLLSTATGIVAIVFGESSVTLITGILVVCFMAAAIGGAIIVYVLLGRRARTVRLQSDLLANVTHDLRTPLSAIRMHAQTLQSGLLREDPVRSRVCLENIVRETEWLEAMIDRVLSWRAAAKDQDILEMKPAPIHLATDEAAERFQRMVPQDEIVFSYVTDGSGEVRYDQPALVLAILNLLINAYKYTKAPKRISLKVQEDTKRVRIAVEDNGIGIPEKEIERIFEPFHRVGASSNKISGAGLGLAIVNHVISGHGGEILVESIEGMGSRFSIILPIHATET